MRILYNSRLSCYKEPFGTLTPGQRCTLHIHIPAQILTKNVFCLLENQDGSPAFSVPMEKEKIQGPYEIYRGEFSLPEPGLFFYYFRITTKNESFKLLRQGGEDTNMEMGDRWQLSCIPADFETPDWAKGAVMYQVFPDRFAKSGASDLTGKLEPYTVHESWNEEVHWQPTPEGIVLNNDFFGGNFQGITNKMDYIASFGVKILYLNPISKAFSSHRYDTFDYKTPDPMLGTEEDFAKLCEAAHERGIRVVLDGVYSHTGSESIYFDRRGVYGGACASPVSPYRSWYKFRHYPDKYECWWDFDTLPCIDKLNPDFMAYVIDSEDSVVAHWLKLGADGFRLDVVDELPDEFVLRLKRRIRELKPDALLIGEVWEDASNKVAYGVRRRYFVDGELDSVMNYPFRTAILQFMTGLDNGSGLKETVMEIAEHYPPQVLSCVMNSLGTHDTPRALTAMVDSFEGSRAEKAQRHLAPNQRLLAKERLHMASFLQYTLPGTPCLYYGDEAGMEGYADPFNRRPFPWGREDQDLQEHFRNLGQLKQEQPALQQGSIQFQTASDGHLAFVRQLGDEIIWIYVNRSEDRWAIPAGNRVIFGRNVETIASGSLALLPMGFCAVKQENI